MENLYVFLIRNDVWIYILCGLGFVWYLSQYLRARTMLRRAMFGLEREKGQTIRRRAITFVLICIALASLVTYVNLEVAPMLPPEILKPPTPTPNIFATPLSSPTPVEALATATLAIAPTVTLPSIDNNTPPTVSGAEIGDQPTSVGPTTTPTPDFALASCTPDINISAPPNNAVASESLTFFGSATADDFRAYDIEALGPQTEGTWESLLDGGLPTPTTNGILATVDISGWEPGIYLFRLFVVEGNGAESGQCVIQISVE